MKDSPPNKRAYNLVRGDIIYGKAVRSPCSAYDTVNIILTMLLVHNVVRRPQSY